MCHPAGLNILDIGEGYVSAVVMLGGLPYARFGGVGILIVELITVNKFKW